MFKRSSRAARERVVRCSRLWSNVKGCQGKESGSMLVATQGCKDKAGLGQELKILTKVMFRRGCL